jgi:hypothetical protein
VFLLELQHRGDVARLVEDAQGGDGGVPGQVGEAGDRRRRGSGVRGFDRGLDGGRDGGVRQVPGRLLEVCVISSPTSLPAPATVPAACSAVSETVMAAPRRARRAGSSPPVNWAASCCSGDA